MKKIYRINLLFILIVNTLFFSCNQNEHNIKFEKSVQVTKNEQVSDNSIKINHTINKEGFYKSRKQEKRETKIALLTEQRSNKKSQHKEYEEKLEEEKKEEEERERKEMEEELLNESAKDSLEANFLRLHPNYKEAINSTQNKAVEERQILKNNALVSRSVGDGLLEDFANNSIQGSWYERGSATHSGNIKNIDYNPTEDAYYAISNTGSLWKRRMADSNWVCLDNDRGYNQEFKVLPSGRIITASVLPNTNSRGMVYIDNINTTNCGFDTLIFAAAAAPLLTQYSGENYLSDITYLTSGANRTVYALAQRGQIGSPAKSFYDLYKSTDDGLSYSIIKTFNHNDSNAVVMWDPGYTTDKTYIIDEDGTTDEKVLYELDVNGITKIADITGIANDYPKGAFERMSHMSIYLDATSIKFLYNHNKGGFVGSTSKIFSYETPLPIPANISFSTLTSTISDKMTNAFLSNSNKNIFYMGSYQVGFNSTNISPLLYKTTNNGTSYNVVNTNNWRCAGNNEQHDDIRVIKSYKKANGNSLIVWGCDGGLKAIENDGTTIQSISNPTNSTFSTTEFNDNYSTRDLNVQEYYDVKTNPTDTSLTWAGAQDFGFFLDNGFSKMRTLNPSDCNSKNNVRNMHFVQSGEGGEIQFTLNGNALWNQQVRGSLRHINTPNPAYNVANCRANQTASINSLGILVQGPVPFNWLMPSSPTPFSKTKDEIFIGGGKPSGSTLPLGSYLLKAAYQSNTNTIVTTVHGTPFDFALNSSDFNTYISAIAVTLADTNRIYVSNSRGKFYTSKNYGQSWTLTSTIGLPSSSTPLGTGTCILASQVDSNLVFMSGNSYPGSGTLAAVFKSTNAGATFTNISVGLPVTGVSVFKMHFNENETKIYAATNAGPYVFDITTSQWFSLKGLGAPTAIYNSVQLVKDNGTLRFGTYGRGIWDLKMSNPNTIAPMQVVNIKTNQVLETPTNSGTENNIVLRIEITTKGKQSPLTLSELKFSLGNSSTFNDIENAKLFFNGTNIEFLTTQQFGTSINNPTSSNLVFTDNVTLNAGVNFLYLVYDIKCTATLNNIVDAALVDLTIAGNVLTSSNGNNPIGNRFISGPTSGTNTQSGSVNSIVSVGTITTPIIRVSIPSSPLCLNTVSQIVFNTANSTNALVDFESATCYYTTSQTFNNNTQFGGIALAPNGNVIFTGNLSLNTSTQNYFWLVYNIKCDAGDANIISAQALSYTSNSTSISLTNTIFSKTINGFAAPTLNPANGVIPNPNSLNYAVCNIKLPATNCYSSINNITYELTKNVSANIYQNARCFYTTTPVFSMANPFGVAITNPSTNVGFTGSLNTINTSDYYFWLVIDFNCVANPGNIVYGKIISVSTNNGNINTLPTSVQASTQLSLGITVTTFVTAGGASNPIQKNSTNQTVLRVLHNRNSTCPVPVNRIVFNTSTSSNPSLDIKNARCYITLTPSFNTNTPYGNTILNPNGDMEFVGAYTQPSNSNIFYWLTYDIACDATTNNTVAAEFLGIETNNAVYTSINSAISYAVTPNINNYSTIANGFWNDPNIWACGEVPTLSTHNVIVNNIVTINNTGNICGALTIENGKNLFIPIGGQLTLGESSTGNVVGSSNKILNIFGSLNILGGELNLNGSVNFRATSSFTMNSGTFNIDPNDGTVGSFNSNTMVILNNNQNVTGGIINFLDPPYNINASTITYSSSAGALNWGVGCVVNIGGGDDVLVGHPGFKINSTTSVTGHLLEIGTLNILSGSALTSNRNLNISGIQKGLIVKNLTVQNGAEITGNANTLSELYIKGNLINNGQIYLGKKIIFCGDIQYNVNTGFYQLSQNNNAQEVSGTGYFLETFTSVNTNQNQNTVTGMESYHSPTSPGLTLSMPLAVKNRIQFSGGKINTSNTNLLTLGTGTNFCAAADINNNTITNFTANNLGWVNGPLKYATTLNTAPLQFLVGNATKAYPMQIRPQIGFGVADGLTVAYNSTNGGANGLPLSETGFMATSIYTDGYWTATTTSNTGAYDVLLSGTDFSNLPANNLANDVRIIKRPNNTSNWIFEGTHDISTGTIVRRNSLTTFSDFAIGQNEDATLAINSIVLQGKTVKYDVLLDWEADVTSNFYTTILQRSEDGLQFIDLVYFNGNYTNKYSYFDRMPEQKNYIYRVKVIENNIFKYSNFYKAKNYMPNNIRIFPNPAIEKITLEGLIGKGQIEIFNNNGALIKRLKTNQHSIIINIQNFVIGNYILVFKNEKDVYRQKFIKK